VLRGPCNGCAVLEVLKIEKGATSDAPATTRNTRLTGGIQNGSTGTGIVAEWLLH